MIFTEEKILSIAGEVIDIEIAGLSEVKKAIDRNFFKAVNIILNTKGRVIVSGVGKSGIIGKKISATMSSVGTPSIFLHPVEALHGDLGIVTADDCIIAISNSGETSEIISLVSILKNRKIPVISLVGMLNSTLAKLSDAVIFAGVKKEACSLGLAPTASTTATLALGDALSIALLECRDFSPEDFKKNHPGGTLGERLKVMVREVMLKGHEIPVVISGTPMKDAVEEINRKKLGAVIVIHNDNKLCGIITDGDIRRILSKGDKIFDMTVDDVMTINPKRTGPYNLAHEALEIMERYLITVLPVSDDRNMVCGIVHLHDLLGKGKFKFIV